MFTLFALLLISNANCFFFSSSSSELALASSSQAKLFSESDEDCAREARAQIGVSCASMNDDERRRIASLFAICHLAKSRKNPPSFSCEPEMSGSDCARLFDPDHINLFDVTFMNVEIICTIGERFGMIRKIEGTVVKLVDTTRGTVSSLQGMQTELSKFGDGMNSLKTKVDKNFETVINSQTEALEQLGNLSGTISEMENKTLNAMSKLFGLVSEMETKTLSALNNLHSGIIELANAQIETANLVKSNLELNKQMLIQSAQVQKAIQDMNKEVTVQMNEGIKKIQTMEQKATSSIETILNSVEPITYIYNQIKSWQRLILYFAMGLAVYWFTIPQIFEKSRRFLLICLILLCYFEKNIEYFNPFELYCIFGCAILFLNFLYHIVFFGHDKKLPVHVSV